MEITVSVLALIDSYRRQLENKFPHETFKEFKAFALDKDDKRIDSAIWDCMNDEITFKF